MKKSILSLILAGCGMFGAAALDLQLRDGSCLPDIQFVRPALRGVTLITTNQYGKSFLVTVPFSAITIPSLYALRQHLMRNRLPPWENSSVHSAAYSASIFALNRYLRRHMGPQVIQGFGSVFIRLGPGVPENEAAAGPAGIPEVIPIQ